MEIEMETSQPIDNSVGTIKILLRPNPFRTSIFGRLQSIPPPPLKKKKQSQKKRKIQTRDDEQLDAHLTSQHETAKKESKTDK